MANEITFIIGLRVRKDELRIEMPTSTIRADMAGEDAESGVQLIGTTYEAISLGDVTTPGFAYFKNVDGTNFIEVGKEENSTFVPFLKLQPGQAAGGPLSSGPFYAKADTAAARLQYAIIEA